MVNSRDVQDVVSRLSSEKAKVREEGIKLLNLWLDGESSSGFCKYIGQNTAQLKSKEVPHAETWPFLVTLLVQCVSLEISASKRRAPKLVYAKTLRITVQRAESARFSGCSFPLISVAKLLFNHIWDVLSHVPSYLPEYGVILRLLLSAKDYCFQMRKRIYASMVLFYMEKVEASLRPHGQSGIKEEPFRCTLMLHSLLENPPGDFPEPTKDDFVNGFVKIFSLLRDEGRIARKLLECVNTYLLRDGPNLGYLSMAIHESVQQFVLRFWLSTHDPCLKDALIVYASLQLCLTREDASSCLLLEQLLDLVFKDLDQRALSGSGMTRSEGVKDEKFSALSGSLPGLVDLASLVLYKANRAHTANKKMRRECAAIQLKEALGEGKWLWIAFFCRLTRVYYNKMSKYLFHYWFESLNASFERIMNDANAEHSYNALLWTLRAFQELSLLLPLQGSHNEFGLDWLGTWNSLVQGLPILSNITYVVDAALSTLGNILLKDLGSSFVVPQDVWDLPIFKRLPSSSVLYFISCYFSRKHSQGGLRDMLHLRKNLLRTILDPLMWRESSSYDTESVLMLPSALCALSTGVDPLRQGNKATYKVQCPQDSINFTEAIPGFKEDNKSQNLYEFLDCSAEAISQTYMESTNEVSSASIRQDVRLPRQFKDPLLSMVEMHISEALSTKEIKFNCLSDVFSTCGMLANLLFGFAKIRMREELSLLPKVAQLLLELLQHAVSIIKSGASDINPTTSDQSGSSNGLSSIVASFKCFVSSHYFTEGSFEKHLDTGGYIAILRSLECLMNSVVNIYESCQYERGSQSDVCSSVTVIRDHNDCMNGSENKGGITDMDLDPTDDINDFDIIADTGDVAGGSPFSLVKWKLAIIKLISCFFSVSPESTWNILFELMKKELDHVVLEEILHGLCKYPYCSSVEKASDMLSFLLSTGGMRMNLKLDCLNIVIAIRSLMAASLSLLKDGKDVNQILFMKDEKSVQQMGELLNEVAKVDLLNWAGRIELVGGICELLLLHPKVGEMLIARLLIILHDCDYRVRLSLARRIDVLFQTWDGHKELFEDICSNFGVLLVTCSNGKVVKAKEVMAAGSQPRPVMETVIITLLHMALHSEIIELEAVFMICGISAVEPALRELVKIVLDFLSRQLQYSSRFKYLEELLGPILFCWTACSVSIVALVEVRHLFVQETEPRNFVQYVCPWLIPALLLYEDATANLKCLSEIVDLPLAALIRSHFVSIFAISMAMYCSKKSHLERGARLVQNFMLCLSDMSESERDNLIKKHMVSMVGFLLSLSSNAPDPAVPLFSVENIFSAIKMVVDGFIDQGDCQARGFVDKINIFREDRVFMFILEIHYKVSAVSHNRHRCHKLGQLEVLIRILQSRVATASTSNYLFNLVGQYIGYPSLQPQCCRIIWSLLENFQDKPSQKMIIVLGEQLQALVSKLVACCIPCDGQGGESSQVLALLKKLLLQTECSLHDYIRELEPFPEIDIFNEFKQLHSDLYQNYSAREHLLKLVKRACHLPPRVLLWSLKALHRKFLLFQNQAGKIAFWQDDPDVVNAVWTLVRMSALRDFADVRALVADLLSRVGIGDPHCVVYHLPWEPDGMHKCDTINAVKVQAALVKGALVKIDPGIPVELVVTLLKVLKKYLMDDSATVVDVTSQALRGILSTAKGQAALSTFEFYDASLIEIHSRGINMELVENILLDMKRKFDAEAIPLEKSILWETNGKKFDVWICQLVSSLIGHSEDVILRLCQDISHLKTEVAELLLPYVMVNLAMKNDEDESFCRLVSLQVENHIFAMKNQLMKSMQIFLKALNELRLCFNESSGVPVLSKRDSLKHSKIPIHESRRQTASRARDLVGCSGSLWKKVYWLSVDYLVVAKSAVLCGQYFTSVMYVEYWCEEHFRSLSLGRPDFSPHEKLPNHIEILVSAITQINEPDSLYGIIQAHQLISQVITFEHEGNWRKAIEYYDLQVRSEAMLLVDDGPGLSSMKKLPKLTPASTLASDNVPSLGKPYKGLIRALQRNGCTHLLDLYFHGLTSCEGYFQSDEELAELEYEAAWRAGNWDFSLLSRHTSFPTSQHLKSDQFNENLLCCLRALKEGEFGEFHGKLCGSKQRLVWLMSHASEESTEYIFSTVMKLQILHHLDQAWDLRWKNLVFNNSKDSNEQTVHSDPLIPTAAQMAWLESDGEEIIKRSQLHMNLLDPFIAFRRVLLNILRCEESVELHLLRSVSTLRKGSRLSQAAASLTEFKHLTVESGKQFSSLYWVGRLEEAKLLHAQGQKEMAISLAKFIAENSAMDDIAPDVHRLIGKWLAETRSSSSRTILENYLKPAVSIAENSARGYKKSLEKQSQAHYQLAHYSYALFRSCEERLNSNEWQAALRLRKHKTLELEALVKRLRSSTKGEKTDFSAKIQELQKQLSIDKEEDGKMQDDIDNFLNLALEGYKRCLVIGDKYDVKVVFCLVSLWFSLSTRPIVINSMLNIIEEVQSYKFVPLVYQIASRLGGSKDGPGPNSFQCALVSLVKKMAVDHPHHTVFQLLALANGDRIKDKQRSRNSFVVDFEKKLAAENLLNELSTCRGALIKQMRQMVEIYIKLAELETRREDTNKRMTLPREIRSVRCLELVPVVTASFPIDRSCQYREGSFPYFQGLEDSIMVMNGINAPKVVECLGSDGRKYRQLAKSGNDDLRQDAVRFLLLF
ncbi:hypothetical protein MLD38_026128 [Melastoma candidum]|uniref:Uncharacterized protein n=1 Tax=Melastoma candidum TaxID=119954 RepID=A0ACB9NXC1_9MYRT|nr:hypothetical protein MLD38_026128 [Melastoma candidum]